MKITNNVFTKFKGYDAVPLRALHIGTNIGEIKNQLQEIAKKEGISIKESPYNQSFNQDFKVILQSAKGVGLLMQDNVEFMEKHVPAIEEHYGMPVKLINFFERACGFIAGGNCYLGKKPNGDKWLLSGAAEDLSLHNVLQISGLYDVDVKDIHFIAQEDYHLDLSIRPIGYPYVLINNPELCLKNEQKARGKKPKKANISDAEAFKMQAYKTAYKQLKNAGFYPIPIGGVYGEDINFINAIVNKHKDGTITYIANSSKCDDVIASKYQRLFEKDLRKKLDEIRKTDPNAPQIRDIYFIQGENYGIRNEMMENLLEVAGGIHCMCLEEPDFSAWA